MISYWYNDEECSVSIKFVANIFQYKYVVLILFSKISLTPSIEIKA